MSRASRQRNSGQDRVTEMLYLFVFTHFRTENRFPLFLEMRYLFVSTHFRTENRFPLFLEML